MFWRAKDILGSGLLNRIARPLFELTCTCFGTRRFMSSCRRRSRRLHYFILQVSNPFSRGFTSVFIQFHSVFADAGFLGLLGLVWRSSHRAPVIICVVISTKPKTAFDAPTQHYSILRFPNSIVIMVPLFLLC